MNIDDQVRQTLHAVADAQRVPEGLARRLQDSPAGPVVGVAPRHRWKRIVPPLLAAAAVIIAAVTTTVVVSTQADQHPPAVPITSIPAPTPTPDLPTPTATNPAPSTSTAPAQAAPTAPTQTALPLGKQGSINDIPWSLVGPGWTIAKWATSYDATTSTIFVVDPAGGRYLLGQVPVTTFLSAWSPDLQRVLLWSRDYSSGTTIMERSTVDWSVVHKFSLGLDADGYPPQVGGYTRPKGLAVLVSAASTGQTRRYSEDGTLQLAYPTSYPSTGTVSGWLYTADGTQLVRGAEHGLAVIRNDGTFVRRLQPPGMDSCYAARWVSPTVVQASCAAARLPTENSVGQVWNLPLDGSKPTAVTPASLTSTVGLGWVAAWPYTGGTLLLEASGCGASIPGRYDGHTFTNLKVTISGQPAGALQLIDVSGNTALLLATACSSQFSRTLVSYNLPAGGSTLLLGAGANGGTVLDTAAYPGDD